MATPRNPYAAPASRVEDAVSGTSVVLIPNGRAVSASHGWHWIVAAWDLFKRSPLSWILITLIAFAILLLSVILGQVGGIAISVLTPALTGGVMLGCAALERGQPLQVAHLFAGFRQHTTPLVIVGLLYLAASAAIVLLVVLVVGVPFMMTMMRGMQGPPWLSPMLLLGGLVALALYLPLVMATWFAPALVALHDMKPVDALKASFVGCLKNIVPFLIYGLVMLGLAVLATLPMLLGLLVYGPLLVASVYTGYRDIYTEPAP